MYEVAPGEMVFSIANRFIKAIGIAASNSCESPKPMAFGQTGAYWDNILVAEWTWGFIELKGPFRPAAHMG
jgi:hypothetical protein